MTRLSSPKPVRRQCGVAMVEFALIAPIFFLLLFGAIEFGRLLYLWNTVQEVTRNAARQAVVTDFRNLVVSPNTVGEIDMIKRSAVFRTSPGALPGSGDLTDAKVRIRYLNDKFIEVNTNTLSPADNVANCAPSPPLANCIAFVEVCVSEDANCAIGVPFHPLVGYLSLLADVHIPPSTMRMPAESLGFRPGM